MTRARDLADLVGSGGSLPAATNIGDVSSTELGYLDGVTSALQTQLSGKIDVPSGWTSYTPSINFTVGNGFLEAYYLLIDDLVNYYIKFTLGSTSTFPSYALAGFPFSGNGQPRGSVLMTDMSTGYYWIGLHMSNGRIANPNDRSISGYSGGSVPFTFAAPDVIQYLGTYRRDV